MTERPGAAARLLDAAALVLVAGGGVLYARAHAGMKSIAASQIHVATIDAPNLVRWNHYRTTSNAGLALVAAGVVVGIVSYLRARRAPDAVTPPA